MTLSLFWKKWDLEGDPELEKRVKKPSYGLWHHKTESSQIVTSWLIFL